MNISKPFIMNIERLELDFEDPLQINSKVYDKFRTILDKNYKKSIDDSTKFVIPKLKTFKRKYYPECCLSNPSFVMRHPHYFYKLLIELESMKDQLDRLIKFPTGVVEVKIEV